MSSARDFVTSSMADALLPSLKRSFEDVVYETLDQRAVPTRTDFKELRDQLNSLRGQLTGATAGVKKLADDVEANQDRLAAMDARFEALDALIAKMEGEGAGALREALPAELKRAVDEKLDRLADDLTRRVVDRLGDRLTRLEAQLSDGWLNAQIIRAREDVLGAVNPRLDARVEKAALDLKLQRFADELSARADAREASLRAEIEALRSAVGASSEAHAAHTDDDELAADGTSDGPADDDGAHASSDRVCRVPDCGAIPRSKGFCACHYQLWRRGRLDGFPKGA